MLEALRTSTEPEHLVKEASRYLKGLKGNLVQLKKRKAEAQFERREGVAAAAAGFQPYGQQGAYGVPEYENGGHGYGVTGSGPGYGIPGAPNGYGRNGNGGSAAGQGGQHTFDWR